jgi:ferredoxin
MRLQVDPARCQGHRLCTLAAPDLIELREDDGHASPKQQNLSEAQLEPAMTAVNACPEHALSLTDRSLTQH